ncbi:hypothetical protein BOVATA_044050 [Babesia ovata]|uniref:Uncharacterized protein n=1 Tax=Babesia ovata TaxID=189622 RepID=A0A2H6KIV5_9APIC|nr:uncharacterized protein BOVATA_044050 [Babesia ovata]GBE62911.1 hypothetical protein BOVATA_044050 [Babesia ovata]
MRIQRAIKGLHEPFQADVFVVVNLPRQLTELLRHLVGELPERELEGLDVLPARVGGELRAGHLISYFLDRVWKGAFEVVDVGLRKACLVDVRIVTAKPFLCLKRDCLAFIGSKLVLKEILSISFFGFKLTLFELSPGCFERRHEVCAKLITNCGTYRVLLLKAIVNPRRNVTTNWVLNLNCRVDIRSGGDTKSSLKIIKKRPSISADFIQFVCDTDVDGLAGMQEQLFDFFGEIFGDGRYVFKDDFGDRF